MKKIIIRSVLAFLAVFIIYGTYRSREAFAIQEDISSKLIRFHIRANSDSDEDQALKMKVKDAVIKYIEEEFTDVETLDEARQKLYDDEEHISEIALQVIRSEGYEYNVNVYFEKAYFPMKVYGDICLPPGDYEAFRIDIGDYEGKNWWCVLYPPLCFVDATYGVVPEESKEKLQSVLDEDEYAAITIANKDDYKYKFEFKFLTFLNDLL